MVSIAGFFVLSTIAAIAIGNMPQAISYLPNGL